MCYLLHQKQQFQSQSHLSSIYIDEMEQQLLVGDQQSCVAFSADDVISGEEPLMILHSDMLQQHTILKIREPKKDKEAWNVVG